MVLAPKFKTYLLFPLTLPQIYVVICFLIFFDQNSQLCTFKYYEHICLILGERIATPQSESQLRGEPCLLPSKGPTATTVAATRQTMTRHITFARLRLENFTARREGENFFFHPLPTQVNFVHFQEHLLSVASGQQCIRHHCLLYILGQRKKMLQALCGINFFCTTCQSSSSPVSSIRQSAFSHPDECFHIFFMHTHNVLSQSEEETFLLMRYAWDM